MRASLVKALLATLAAATMLTGAAPITEAAPAAQLSVTLKSSEKTVTAGDSVTYTGQVRNLGDADADVTIVLDAPPYVKLSDTEGATVEKNQATWSTKVATAKTTSFTLTAMIGKIPTTERRVTTLASVYVGDSPSPVVRTADASFITGVSDAPGGKATGKPAAQSSTQSAVVGWSIAGGVLVLLVILGAVVLILRRRRGRRSPRTAA